MRSLWRQPEAAPVLHRLSASSPAEPQAPQPVQTQAMARAATELYSLRVERPQHHERAPALASVPSFPCSARPPSQARVQMVSGRLAQPQATPRAKAQVSESAPQRPAAAA